MKYLPLLVFLVLGCASQNKPVLTKRYEAHAGLKKKDNLVKISAFSLPAPSGTSRTTIRSLDGRAQAALINSLNSKVTSASELMTAVGRPIGSSSAGGLVTDRTLVRRRAVVSLLRSEHKPADRLERIEIHFKIDPAKAKFRGWDKFITEYGTVDLGTLSRANESTDTISGGIDISAFIGEITPITFSDENKETFTEADVKLRRRYLKLTGVLKEDQATLVLEGVPGIDLAGNISVDFSLDLADHRYDVETTRFAQFFDKNGAAQPAANVRFSHRFVGLPKETLVKPDLWVDYRLRSVTKGMETIVESDDHIEIVTGTSRATPNFTLLPDEIVDNTLFTVTWSPPWASTPIPVQFADLASGKPRALYFESWENARSLLRWLEITRPSAGLVAGGRLVASDRRGILQPLGMSTVDVENLQIDRKTFN